MYLGGTLWLSTKYGIKRTYIRICMNNMGFSWTMSILLKVLKNKCSGWNLFTWIQW